MFMKIRNLFIFPVMLLLSATTTTTNAQSREPAAATSTSEANAKASLEISRRIIVLVGDMVKGFPTSKGELLTTTDDGTKVYMVNDMEEMMAETQYIMIKSNGAAYYMANYEGDVEKLTMSFTAFTGGITTLTKGSGDIVIEQDKAATSGDKLVFVMSIKGKRVGSYSLNVSTNTGTLIIGLL